MPKEARIGLLIGATCCLLAVLADWVVAELTAEAGEGGGAEGQPSPAPAPAAVPACPEARRPGLPEA